MGDKTRGLFGKFNISRTDGSDAPGGKHDGCEYFVLDVTHDPFALSALADYAHQCDHDGYNKLASDLGAMIQRGKKSQGIPFSHTEHPAYPRND